jgi:hypothetical protein
MKKLIFQFTRIWHASENQTTQDHAGAPQRGSTFFFIILEDYLMDSAASSRKHADQAG